NKLTPGLHTVTVKDANGCTINDRKTITALAVVTCNLSQLNEDDEDDATATPNVYAGCIYCLNDEDVEHLTRYQIKPTIGPKEVVANYIIFGGPAAPDRAVSRWANP
ncbi:MAG: hypothetical protein ONB44_00985, partial [candidate division KSB1 bacterium]|nr:hypothetical protein [candidate division KSB1 bacterium]